MADISVNCTKNNGGWTCEVQVRDSGTSSHTVEVPRPDYEALVDDTDRSVDQLVKESFEFLLEREPQSAIMSQFEIRTIERYFPEYPDEIPERLGNRPA